MENGITERQNEERSINLLAAQRQLYNEVKRVNGIGVLFAVFIPLVLAVVQLIIENETLSAVSYVASITSMFIALGVSAYVKNEKKLAAEVQQHFDIYVYQIQWDTKLFGKMRDVTHCVMEKSKKLYMKSGEREKLIDWYTSPVGLVELKKGILLCQKENFHWDVSLRKRYKTFCIIIIGVLTVAILALGVIKNESTCMLLYRFAFIVPMVQWLFQIVVQINDDVVNLMECDELLNSSATKTMNELQEIQGKIYNHRKSCLAIPNWFYERYKDNDEDTAHRSAAMNNTN
ncbi:MAG: S-4TM family putative pore-forming effector [bacterium]|nr:S-4TM family putative pore-forming effector [bacterium]